jgi:hypothetical protein
MAPFVRRTCKAEQAENAKNAPNRYHGENPLARYWRYEYPKKSAEKTLKRSSTMDFQKPGGLMKFTLLA